MCLGMLLILRAVFASLRGLKSGFSANDIPLAHLPMGPFFNNLPLATAGP